jgi:5-methylcytosine-specific restriction enzyme subunit McrC
MYVLSVLRKAAAPLTVTHGTRDRSATKKLLRSELSDQGLGTLIPDAILLSDSVIKGVIDAKYKSLHPSASSPNGPQRDDLYQMAAYLGRFQSPAGMVTWGILAYPFDPSKPDTPFGELNSPWSLDEWKKIVFATLPHNPTEAVAKLRSLVAQSAIKPPFGGSAT